MQGSDERIPYRGALYAIVLAAALFLRLYHLGAAPLSDFEARTALRARSLLHGGDVAPYAQPLAVTGTSVLFFLFGENNFTARLLSAVLGSVLALLPWFWRRTLGERTALLLAAGLTFAPGLVALSRLSGGPMVALSLGAALLTAWHREAPLEAGIFFGLFLLGGPWALTGALGFALALGIARWGGLPLGWLPFPRRAEAASRRGVLPQAFFWGAGGAFLLGATLFLRFPQGLGAFGEMLSAWGGAVFRPAGVSFLRVLSAWAFYHLLALLIGLAGVLLAWRENLAWGRFAILWTLTALLAALLPGRTVFDAAWGLLPLYLLAALGLSRALSLPAWEKTSAWLFALFVVVVLALVWLTLAGIPGGEPSLRETWSRWALLAGALLALLVSGIFLTLGWERNAGLWGGAMGATLALGLVMLSQTWGLMAHPDNPAELWYPSPSPVNTGLLLDTLGDAAEWHAGRRDALSIRLDVASPALQWALRDFDLILPAEADALTGTLPLAVIAPEDAPAPNGEVLYRGQRFLWAEDVGWEGALPPGGVRWFVFREAPLRDERLIVWLRGDLFPGGSVLPPASENSLPSTGEQLTP